MPGVYLTSIHYLKKNLEVRCQYYLNSLHKAQVRTLCSIERNAMSVYDRVRCNQHCLDLYEDSVMSIIKNTTDLDETIALKLFQSIWLVVDDLSKVHPCAAAMAWLDPTVSLNEMFDDPFVPLDLNYGLLFYSFIPTLRVCNYLAKAGSYEADKALFQAQWSSVDYNNKLLHTTSTHLQMTSQQVLEEVQSVIAI